MKKEWKGFAIGFIVAVLMFSTIIPAVASTSRQVTANYNDIKITLDNVEVVPKDANGNVVEPFIIDGTTYLPVRAVANALGLNVEWDGKTHTVKLTNPDTVVTPFDKFKSALDNAGYSYETVAMAADLVGAQSGTKYKFDFGTVELYQFEEGSDILKSAVANGGLSLPGFGVFPCHFKGNLALIVDVNENEDAILNLFNSL